MAARSWRKKKPSGSAAPEAASLAAGLLDEKQCIRVDEQGTPCGKPAWNLGYCTDHWGR
ncbi:hypothetical protein ACGF5F_29540 [Streptomyces sp. NPDC047821]|uniref:hypothetical protein n=1 Tax=Streptomyces sp. NPDC047821 TaxID=3365488 RepID=UPI003713F550